MKSRELQLLYRRDAESQRTAAESGFVAQRAGFFVESRSGVTSMWWCWPPQRERLPERRSQKDQARCATELTIEAVLCVLRDSAVKQFQLSERTRFVAPDV